MIFTDQKKREQKANYLLSPCIIGLKERIILCDTPLWVILQYRIVNRQRLVISVINGFAVSLLADLMHNDVLAPGFSGILRIALQVQRTLKRNERLFATAFCQNFVQSNWSCDKEVPPARSLSGPL